MKKLSDNILIFSIIAAAILYVKGTYWYETWAVKWFFLGLLMTVFIGLKAFWRVHWMLSICFIYTVISGLATFATRGNYYMNGDIEELLAIKFNAAYSTFCFAFIFLFLHFYKKKFDVIERALVLATFMNIPYTVFRWYGSHWDLNGMGGMFGNPSTNMCFFVVMIPMIFKHYWKHDGFLLIGWRCLVYLLAIAPLLFIAQKIIAVVALFAILTAFLVYRSKKFVYVVLAALTIFTIGYTAHHTKNFTEVNEITINNVTHYRSKVWVWAMNWWQSHPDMLVPGQKDHPQISKLFGAGNGTVPVLVPKIQAVQKDREGYFMWFHSEPIQTIFEMGYVGFALWFIMALIVLFESYKTPYLFCSVVGFGVVMSMNYPLHMAFQALFGALIMFRSLTNNTLRLKNRN